MKGIKANSLKTTAGLFNTFWYLFFCSPNWFCYSPDQNLDCVWPSFSGAACCMQIGVKTGICIFAWCHIYKSGAFSLCRTLCTDSSALNEMYVCTSNRTYSCCFDDTVRAMCNKAARAACRLCYRWQAVHRVKSKHSVCVCEWLLYCLNIRGYYFLNVFRMSSHWVPQPNIVTYIYGGKNQIKTTEHLWSCLA